MAIDNQRLAEFMKLRNLSQKQMAKDLGKSQAAISQWLKTGKLGIDTLKTISDTYGIALEWFIGLSDSMEKPVLLPPGIPFFDAIAMAGSPTKMFNISQEPTSYLRLPGIERGELALSVSGDSMLPVLAHGDIIVCRKAPISAQTIFTGFYVVCFDDSIVVKSVRRDPGQPYLHLISSNPQYPPIVVPAEAITQLYQVLFRVQFSTF